MELKAGAEINRRLITPPLLGTYSDEPFKTHFDQLATLYYAWSKAVRRSVIEAHRVRFNQKKLVEDGIFYARWFRYNPRTVTLTDTPLYIYTLGRGGSAIGSFHPDDKKGYSVFNLQGERLYNDVKEFKFKDEPSLYIQLDDESWHHLDPTDGSMID